MLIIKKLQNNIKDIVANLDPPLTTQATIQIDFTKDETHGELTTNIAMILGKELKQNPKKLAETIAKTIEGLDYVAKVEVAGTGFINMTLATSVWIDELKDIVKLGKAYANVKLSDGELVHVEYVSANPTGPMHTGHVRNAVLGDTIASILEKVGYKVYREYYINDAGGQIDCLARSLYLRYLEALGTKLSADAFEGNLYPGDYLIPIGGTVAKENGNIWEGKPQESWIETFRDISVKSMMQMIKHDLEQLGIVMDCYTSEKEIINSGKLQEALTILEKRGDIYKGILTPPKGHTVDDWEERPQTLFKSTRYGDEIDRPLCKSDNSWTYFAGDIAYHLDKFQRGFRKMINVLGADHCGYVSRLQAAVMAVTDEQAKIDVKLFQIVNFFENGIPVKMSKRAGTFITSNDLIERVGKDVTRFMMISRHNSTVIDFDFEKVVEQSHNNPIFYIQYANARICSVLKYAKEVFPQLTEEKIKQCETLDSINDKAEISVIRCLVSWPKVIEQAAINLEPHRITNYLYTLAGTLHSLWNKGKENLHLRFVDPNNERITEEKLFLLSSVANILADGLELIGIAPIEEMR